MKLSIVKETNPVTRSQRYFIEKNGIFVDGTLTQKPDLVQQQFDLLVKAKGNIEWIKEEVKTIEL